MTNVELDSMENLINKLKEHSEEVYSHSMLVKDVSLFIGKVIKLSMRELDILTVGAIFHDIGKIKVPQGILKKKGNLKDIERTIIRNHVTTGVSIMSEIYDDLDTLNIIGLHHINEDGSGYKALIVDKSLKYTELVKIVHAANILANTLSMNEKVTAKSMKAKLKESVENNNIVNINIQKVILTNLENLYDYMKNYEVSNDSISKILGV